MLLSSSNTPCCLFCLVFNLFKKFSEKKLFTVITSGLLAAFYSLCTEIKTLYLAKSLSACAFLCAGSNPFENWITELNKECFKMWLSILTFLFASIFGFVCAESIFHVRIWGSASFSSHSVHFVHPYFCYFPVQGAIRLSDLRFLHVPLPLHNSNPLFNSV